MSCDFPGKKDFTIYVGQSFQKNIVWTADNSPVNLTGYSAKFIITYGNTTVTTLTNGSGITLGTTNGTINLLIVDTTSFTPCNGSYQLFLTSGTGFVTCLLNGVLTIREGI